MEISGIFDLTTGENHFIDCLADKYEDELWSVYSINNEENDFSRKAAVDYLGNVQRIVDSVDSMFLIVMYDKKEKHLLITSDISTSTHNLYYTQSRERLFYSTSLKWVLKESKIDRKLNAKGAKCFLLNGYIFGNDTLVDNVRKLSFSDVLNAKKDSFSLSRYDYNIKSKSESEAEELYGSAIVDAITKSANERDLHMPLSGGYDSNFILAILHSLPGKRIHTYTIGSKDGSNEVPVALEITELYGDITNSNHIINRDSIQDLPEIVWRLDGAVYEHGVFLQYELAKLAAQNHATSMVCGECNNQIQSSQYIADLRTSLAIKQKSIKEFKLNSSPFVATNLMVLKKSSLMLNSFGINGLYPYKNKAIVELADSLKELNEDNRLVFKDICAKFIDGYVFTKLQQRGGTTGIKSIADSELLSELRRKIKKHRALRLVRHNHTHVIYIEGTIKHYRRKLYRYLHKVVNDITIRELYICLFYELFITGRFDNSFAEDTVEYSLSDFYGEL